MSALAAATENSARALSAIGFFLLFGFLFGFVSLLASSLVRPQKPGGDKDMTYECGEVPVGGAWFRMNLRYTLVALLFVLFAVEVVFVFPLAAIYREAVGRGSPEQPSLAGPVLFGALMAFLGILVLGLVYAWRKGDLEWVRGKIGGQQPASPEGEK